MILEKPVLVQNIADNLIPASGIDTGYTYSTFCITPTGKILLGGDGAWLHISDDNGETWSPQYSTVANCIALCVTSTGRIIAGTSSNTYYSDDNGETWDQASGIDKRINCLCITRTGRILAGTSSNGLYYSDDNGETWLQLSSWANTDDYIYSLCITPTGRIITSSYPYGIYYSDDNGTTWVQQNSINPILASDIHITRTGRLVTGSEFTNDIYYSDDNGVNWTCLTAAIYNSSIHSIHVASTGRIIGSGNNGLYYSDDNGLTWIKSSLQQTVNAFFTTTTGRLLLADKSNAVANPVYYSDPVYTMRDTYMSKPLTGAQAKVLVQQCKAYVQALKNGN